MDDKNLGDAGALEDNEEIEEVDAGSELEENEAIEEVEDNVGEEGAREREISAIGNSFHEKIARNVILPGEELPALPPIEGVTNELEILARKSLAQASDFSPLSPNEVVPGWELIKDSNFPLPGLFYRQVQPFAAGAMKQAYLVKGGDGVSAGKYFVLTGTPMMKKEAAGEEERTILESKTDSPMIEKDKIGYQIKIPVGYGDRSCNISWRHFRENELDQFAFVLGQAVADEVGFKKFDRLIRAAVIVKKRKELKEWEEEEQKGLSRGDVTKIDPQAKQKKREELQALVVANHYVTYQEIRKQIQEIKKEIDDKKSVFEQMKESSKTNQLKETLRAEIKKQGEEMMKLEIDLQKEEADLFAMAKIIQENGFAKFDLRNNKNRYKMLEAELNTASRFIPVKESMFAPQGGAWFKDGQVQMLTPLGVDGQKILNVTPAEDSPSESVEQLQAQMLQESGVAVDAKGRLTFDGERIDRSWSDFLDKIANLHSKQIPSGDIKFANIMLQNGTFYPYDPVGGTALIQSENLQTKDKTSAFTPFFRSWRNAVIGAGVVPQTAREDQLEAYISARGDENGDLEGAFICNMRYLYGKRMLAGYAGAARKTDWKTAPSPDFEEELQQEMDEVQIPAEKLPIARDLFLNNLLFKGVIDFDLLLSFDEVVQKKVLSILGLETEEKQQLVQKNPFYIGLFNAGVFNRLRYTLSGGKDNQLKIPEPQVAAVYEKHLGDYQLDAMSGRIELSPERNKDINVLRFVLAVIGETQKEGIYEKEILKEYAQKIDPIYLKKYCEFIRKPEWIVPLQVLRATVLKNKGDLSQIGGEVSLSQITKQAEDFYTQAEIIMGEKHLELQQQDPLTLILNLLDKWPGNHIVDAIKALNLEQKKVLTEKILTEYGVLKGDKADHEAIKKIRAWEIEKGIGKEEAKIFLEKLQQMINLVNNS